MSEIEEDSTPSLLSGSLLLAHPALKDPHFVQTVVLVYLHTEEDGALGVILNRPLHKNLGDTHSEFALSHLSDVPVFNGGPVEPEKLILVAWKHNKEDGMLRLYFGISAERAEALLSSGEDYEIKAFVGYSGWSQGQLENELSEDMWIVTPMNQMVADADSTEEYISWSGLLTAHAPQLKLLLDMPEDPAAN